ncbi:MAG: hypothetical protein WC807_12855 [Hyphomicrobium sp.]|jgi:hypothetical protein
MQLPMSAQDFCGQLGQGLKGLWQGISAFAATADRLELANADVAAKGTANSAPSMATMPSSNEQRCNMHVFMRTACHRHCSLASNTAAALAGQ